MSTLLVVRSSLFGNDGQSSRLASQFVTQWQQAHPRGRVVVRDLAQSPIPHLDGARMTALATPAEARTPDQQLVAAQSDRLIDELQAADTIVFAVPMYNFGVPSTLKAYFDHVARAGITFRYTAAGPEGLIRGKKVVVLATRGGLYAGTAADSQTAYVRDFLGFLGMTDLQFVYAEGLAMGEDAQRQGLAQARETLDALLAGAQPVAA